MVKKKTFWTFGSKYPLHIAARRYESRVEDIFDPYHTEYHGNRMAAAAVAAAAAALPAERVKLSAGRLAGWLPAADEPLADACKYLSRTSQQQIHIPKMHAATADFPNVAVS